MNKPIYKSKTVWGSLLLGLEAGAMALPGAYVYPEAVVTAVGVFLTGWGFRDALN